MRGTPSGVPLFNIDTDSEKFLIFYETFYIFGSLIVEEVRKWKSLM